MLNPNYSKNIEVNKLLELIKAANIVSFKQATAYLYALGLNENRVKSVLEILKKNTKVCFSKDKAFICVNEFYLENASGYHSQIKNVIWLYIALLNNFKEINLYCKYPCKAFMFNYDSIDTLHIFQIKSDTLYDDCINIDTNFSTPAAMKKPIHSIILIDDINAIDDIVLSKGIDIIAFAAVHITDDKGTVRVRFYDENKQELEVK